MVELINKIAELLTYLKALPISQKIYLFISTTISGILSYHTELESSLTVFAIVVTLDSITRIHADAKKKKLKFNPFALYFWKEIKSKGLREMCEKIFLEYGVYLLIAFAVDKYILEQMVIFEFNSKHLTLPILAIWIFSFIETWSIAENVEDAGGKNIFKLVHELLPEKLQTVVEHLKTTKKETDV